MTSSTIPTTDMSFPFVNDEKPARPAKLGRKKGAGSTLMEGGDRKKKSKVLSNRFSNIDLFSLNLNYLIAYT